jgi:hypothetical protein
MLVFLVVYTFSFSSIVENSGLILDRSVESFDSSDIFIGKTNLSQEHRQLIKFIRSQESTAVVYRSFFSTVTHKILSMNKYVHIQFIEAYPS